MEKEHAESDAPKSILAKKTNTRQKSVKFAEEVAPVKQQVTVVETQFTHLKVKKPDEKE